MNRKIFSLSLTGMFILLTACSPLFSPSYANEGSDEPDVENGERIYFTATSARGGRISFTEGPDLGGMMMGSYLTCAACHGPAAQGGEHIMHMTVMDAPDIRYEELAEEMEEHGGEGGEYDLDTFKKAVIDGQHPDGDSLDEDMPRWKMSDADLADLFAFLQSLE